MPKNHPITLGLRKEYERLVGKHGVKGMIPVYEHGGVFVFDYKLDTSRLSGAKDLAALTPKPGEKQGQGIPKAQARRSGPGGAGSSSSSNIGAWKTVAAGKKSTPMEQAIQQPSFRRQRKA